MNEQQIVLREESSAERPVIVLQGLSDEQFTQVMQLFAPPPRTKATLWTQPQYTKTLVKVAAFCESVMYMRPNGGCFASPDVANNLDSCMIQKFRDDNTDFFFSVNEWFNNTRGEVPDLLKNWEPDKEPYDPMPQCPTGVDWCAKLTEIDMQYPGFLDLFSNCIDMDEEFVCEVAKRRHGASTAFGDHAGTKMPSPRQEVADFSNFTPSGLLGFNGGGGLQFGT